MSKALKCNDIMSSILVIHHKPFVCALASYCRKEIRVMYGLKIRSPLKDAMTENNALKLLTRRYLGGSEIECQTHRT